MYNKYAELSLQELISLGESASTEMSREQLVGIALALIDALSEQELNQLI